MGEIKIVKISSLEEHEPFRSTLAFRIGNEKFMGKYGTVKSSEYNLLLLAKEKGVDFQSYLYRRIYDHENEQTIFIY